MSIKPPTEDELARVRADYEACADSPMAIAYRHGRNPSTIRRWVRRYGWTRHDPDAPRLPAATTGAVRVFRAGDRCPGLAACPFRPTFVAALLARIGERLERLRQRLADDANLEADVKLLGHMAQTLERVLALEQKEADRRGQDSASTPAEGPSKVELARRLARLADQAGA